MEEPSTDEIFEQLRDMFIEMILRKSQFVDAIDNEARNHMLAARLVHDLMGRVRAVALSLHQEFEEDEALGKYD